MKSKQNRLQNRRARNNVEQCRLLTCYAVGSTWRNIPEDGILHSHRRENLKSLGTTLAVTTELHTRGLAHVAMHDLTTKVILQALP
jgi:hypothetical protein